MARHVKYALAAVVLGLALGVTPYLVMYISTRGSGFVTSQTFFDDFNSQTLNSKWKFFDALGNSSFDLTTQAGWLIISTTSPPNRNITSGPRLVLPNISGDFNITTKIQLLTASGNGSAGILVWKTNDDYEEVHDTLNSFGTTLVRSIIFDGDRFYLTGPGSASQHAGDSIDLILRRQGNNFTASYIVNGVESPPDTEGYSLNGPLDVGISVSSIGEGKFSAAFDYVSIDFLG